MRLWQLLRKYREIIAYVFFGVTTVIVNMVVFGLLSQIMPELWANTLTFFITVQYAYMTNTKFVFQQNFTRENFLTFWGMRIGILLIDDGGLWLLLNMSVNSLVAKFIINAVEIGINYICSKFYIFRKS